MEVLSAVYAGVDRHGDSLNGDPDSGGHVKNKRTRIAGHLQVSRGTPGKCSVGAAHTPTPRAASCAPTSWPSRSLVGLTARTSCRQIFILK